MNTYIDIQGRNKLAKREDVFCKGKKDGMFSLNLFQREVLQCFSVSERFLKALRS